MSKIKFINAREIPDSRGNPTVVVELTTDDGAFLSSVPSGVSKGKYEAKALLAKDAVRNVNNIIAPELQGRNIAKQKEIDDLMIALDSAEDKSKLGANAILAVSIAVCRAGAGSKNIPLYKYIADDVFSEKDKKILVLPKPCFNIIEGGAHARNDLVLQEFMVVPQFGSFADNLRAGKKVYQNLKNILKKKFGDSGTELGDEAGFAPLISKTKEALDLLLEVIAADRDPSSVSHRGRVSVGLDCAGSQFFENNKYNFEGKKLSPEELLLAYQDLIENYPIIFLEDPFAEEDFEGWQQVSSLKFQVSGGFIIGDDLTATNPKRIQKAKENKACNGVVIKPNQIGAVTETLEAVKLAKSFGWKIMVSHRSGETNDDFIADLAVGIEADFIKAGAPSTEERMAKYNRLLKIEQETKNPPK